MAIPFKSLRYRSGLSQIWGIQLRRAIRRKNEWTYLTPVPAFLAGPQALNRISSAGTLVGLDLPPASKNLEIKPYAISRLTTDRLRTPPLSNDANADVGVDLKFGVTANLTADFTYNTDFAQVEIDEQQVNLTRFNLFFPEKRDVLRRSSVGAMFTNRSVSTVAAGSNQAYGVDGALSFFENVSLGAYLARTETPGLRGRDASYQTRFEYGGDRYGARAEYLGVGDNFNPEVGFLRRDNFRRSFASLRFSPRPVSITSVRKFTWEGSVEYTVNGAGSLETRLQTGRFTTEFESSDQMVVEASTDYELLVKPFVPPGSHVTIPTGGYRFSQVLATYTFGAQRRASGAFSIQRGQYYDGTITAFGYSGGRISATRQLSVEPSLSINQIDLPGGRFTTKVLRARTDYAFSPRMF